MTISPSTGSAPPIENILSFDRRNKGCRIIKLEQNWEHEKYLPPQEQPHRNNRAERQVPLDVELEGERVTVYRAENEADEARFIIKQIMEGITKAGDSGIIPYFTG